jgi:hypothetical protein
METAFVTGLRRANLCSLRIMSEVVTVNDIEIRAAIDDLSQTTFARSGGRTDNIESALFVSEEEWTAAGGKMGSVITFSSGKTSRVQKVHDFQGVLFLGLTPFKP